MKLTIENIATGKTKITLNFNKKDYSEIWAEVGNGCLTTDETIIEKMEEDGIYVKGTAIQELVDNIEESNFDELAELEHEQ